MEIARLKTGVKIKSKVTTIAIEEFLKQEANATIFLHDTEKKSFLSENDGVVIADPGEYEVGGIKIKGQVYEGNLVYSFLIDGVSVLLGTLSAFEKMHTKLHEHDIVVIDCDTAKDPSFMSGLGVHSVLFYGAHGDEVAKLATKENLQTMSKFVTTKDKLAQELETVLLQ